jgi:hypothetical protein
VRTGDNLGLLAGFGEAQGHAHILRYEAAFLFVAGRHRPSPRHL